MGRAQSLINPCFSDVIKIEILFKHSLAPSIRTHSSRAKKLYRATLSRVESKTIKQRKACNDNNNT